MRIHPFPARQRLLAVVISAAAMLLLLFVPLAAYAQANTAPGLYQQTNLVSNLPNVAKFQDSNLVNPWGLSHSPTSPWWISDNGTGVSTLYKGDGTAVPLVVTIPPPAVGTPALTGPMPSWQLIARLWGRAPSTKGLLSPVISSMPPISASGPWRCS